MVILLSESRPLPVMEDREEGAELHVQSIGYNGYNGSEQAVVRR